MKDSKGVPEWLEEVRYTDKSYKFNIDHPFKLDGTKSFVFYPYHFDVKQVEPFRIFLESKGYELIFSTYSEYGSGTFKVIVKHENDLEKFFEKGFKRIQARSDSINKFWKEKNKRNSLNV